MTRFILAAFGTIALVFIFFSLFFLKDSYKLLPISGSDPKFAPAFSDWYQFKSPKGSFQAKFPKMPQTASQTVNDPKTKNTRQYDMYVSEQSNGTILMVSVIDFQDHTESMEILKKTIVNDLLVSNPQNQLKNMQVGQYELFKTIDFIIDNPITTIHGRTFSDGNVIYLLTAIFNKDFYDPSEYEHFIKSFEWMGPQ